MSLADDLMKLEDLRRSGALTEVEFAQAKLALLDGTRAEPAAPVADLLADQLAETRRQNDLAEIDRAWQIEREQYLVADRYGRRHVPTVGYGLGGAVVVGVFGVFWTIMAFAITSGGPDEGPFGLAKVFFPLFGVVFTVAGIGYGIYSASKAEQYQKAFKAYQERRARARGDGRPGGEAAGHGRPASVD
jgi:hypothetical protein